MRTVAGIAFYCVKVAVRHPRTPIMLPNPGKAVSPIPWWGSITVLILGIISWCIAEALSVNGLDEASRAMVYIPLTNMFNMGWRLRSDDK